MVNLFINFPRKSVISEKGNFMDSITVPILKRKFYQLRQCNNSSLVKIRKPILTMQKTTFHLKADRLIFTSTTPEFWEISNHKEPQKKKILYNKSQIRFS